MPKLTISSRDRKDQLAQNQNQQDLQQQQIDSEGQYRQSQEQNAGQSGMLNLLSTLYGLNSKDSEDAYRGAETQRLQAETAGMPVHQDLERAQIKALGEKDPYLQQKLLLGAAPYFQPDQFRDMLMHGVNSLEGIQQYGAQKDAKKASDAQAARDEIARQRTAPPPNQTFSNNPEANPNFLSHANDAQNLPGYVSPDEQKFNSFISTNLPWLSDMFTKQPPPVQPQTPQPAPISAMDIFSPIPTKGRVTY